MFTVGSVVENYEGVAISCSHRSAVATGYTNALIHVHLRVKGCSTLRIPNGYEQKAFDICR